MIDHSPKPISFFTMTAWRKTIQRVWRRYSMYNDDTKSCTCLAGPPTSYHLKPSSAFENHPVLNLSVTKKQQIIFHRLICMLFCLHEIVTEDVQSRRNLRAKLLLTHITGWKNVKVVEFCTHPAIHRNWWASKIF